MGIMCDQKTTRSSARSAASGARRRAVRRVKVDFMANFSYDAMAV
jgi:hypothetical protein